MPNGPDHFIKEVEAIINRFRLEYEMNYAELVGCLEYLKAGVIHESQLEQDCDSDEADD